MICQQDLTNWLSTQNPIQNIFCLMVSIAFIHHNAGFYQSPNLSLVLLVTWCSEVIVSDYSLRGDHAETSCSPFKNGHRSFATPEKGHFATPKFGHAILNGPPCIKNNHFGVSPMSGHVHVYIYIYYINSDIAGHKRSSSIPAGYLHDVPQNHSHWFILIIYLIKMPVKSHHCWS